MRRRRLILACVVLSVGTAYAADVRPLQPIGGTGTAGTSASQVVTVQGVSSGTAGAGALGVQGQVGNNVAAAGNPVATAGLVTANAAAPTAATAGNNAALLTDPEHRLLVRDSHPNFFSCNVSNVTAATQCQAAPAASTFLYVTDVVLSNGATAQSLQLISGTGSACVTGTANVTPLLFHAVNATTSITFNTPVRLAAATALCCTRGGTTAFSCMISGYTGP